MLGTTLVDVVRIEHARGQATSARKFGGKAITLLEDAVKYRGESVEVNRALGEAYFRLGSIYAILLQDHTAAVPWYDKSRGMIKEQLYYSNAYARREVGEWFVSMGVSYWETRSRERAIEVTKRGIDFIQAAVVENTSSDSSLQIPYGNLAYMFRQIGNDDKSNEYTRLSARHRGKAGKTRRLN